MFGAKRALADDVRALSPQHAGKHWFQLRQADVIAAVAARHPGLDPQDALSAEARDNLRRYALGDPGGFAGMAADKVLRLWSGYTVGTHRTARPWITAVHLTLVLLAAATLLGGLLTSPRRPELWLLALVLLSSTAVNAILVSEARHNLTLMPAVAAVAAAGACVLAPWLRHRWSARPAESRWRPAGAVESSMPVDPA